MTVKYYNDGNMLGTLKVINMFVEKTAESWGV